jgi:lactoylglutathione lyase
VYIHHLAIWTKDLENMRKFYLTYFQCKSNQKYNNAKNSFESYFLEFDGGAKLELMTMPSIPDNLNDARRQNIGLMHFSVSVGTREKVIALTQRLRADGYEIVSEPRETGDGFFESCILDPEGNRVELAS